MKNTKKRIRGLCFLLICLFLFYGCRNSISTFENNAPDLSKMIGYWYSHSDLVFYDIRDNGTVCRYRLVIGFFDAQNDPNAEFFNEYSDFTEGTYELGEQYLHIVLSDGSEQDFIYLKASDRMASFEKNSFSNYTRMSELPKKHVPNLFPDYSRDEFRGFLSYDMVSDLMPDWIAASAKAKYDLAGVCSKSEIRDRPAVYGDFVTLYYTITSISGTPCDYSMESTSCLLIHEEDSNLFYQITDQIVGLSIDDPFSGTIIVPEDYTVPDFAGQTITVHGTLANIYDIQTDEYRKIVDENTLTYAGDNLWKQITKKLSDCALPEESLTFFRLNYRERFSKRAFLNGTPYLQYLEDSKLTEEMIEYYSLFYTVQFLLSEEIFEQQSLSVSQKNHDDALASLVDVFDMIQNFDTLDNAYEYINESEPARLIAKEKYYAATEWLLEQSMPE